MLQKPPLSGESRWAERLNRSGYFFGALLFHLVLFLMVATWIVIRNPAPPQDVAMETPHLPPVATVIKPPVTSDVPTAPSTPMDALIDTNKNDPSSSPKVEIQIDVKAPTLVSSLGGEATRITRKTPSSNSRFSPEQVEGIRDTVENKWNRPPGEIASHDPKATFVVYVASYANGDWSSSSNLDKDGNIVAGSIPNLMAKIKEWSHGEVKGELVPKPLAISSPDLLDKMPPFIFFTGHKDFVLTQAEIDNLRAYLNKGGAIWGDNALAGAGSRFDVAFHREMKRVVPDLDAQFKPFSLDDKLFTDQHNPITTIPSGMNYYAEMPQHLDLGGFLAILYTPNDYSDMLFMRVLPGDEEVYVPNDPPANTLYTNRELWEQQGLYYRNFNRDSSLAVQRLGMNVVTYLLTRFDDMLLLSH